MKNATKFYKMFEFLEQKGIPEPVEIKALAGKASDEELFNHKVELAILFTDVLAYDKLEYLLKLMPTSMMPYINEVILYNGYANYKLVQLLVNKDKEAFSTYSYLTDTKIKKIISLSNLTCFKLWIKYCHSTIFNDFVYTILGYYDKDNSPYDKNEQDQSNVHLKYIFQESGRKYLRFKLINFYWRY